MTKNNIQPILNYNNKCAELYKDYIIKHHEFLNLYTIIQKVYNINTIISNNNHIIVEMIDNIVDNNIDISKIKNLIHKQQDMVNHIESLYLKTQPLSNEIKENNCISIKDRENCNEPCKWVEEMNLCRPGHLKGQAK